MNNRNRRESLFNLIFTVGLFLIVVIFAIVEIKKISTIKEENSSYSRNDGIWLIDSTGKSTCVDMTTYVDKLVAVNETATTIFGVNYSKEGQMSLLDVDCDIKDAFENLNCTRMNVEIKIGDIIYHQTYAKGVEDGFIYLIETDKEGNILRDDKGNVNILKRCDFTDIYLGEE